MRRPRFPAPVPDAFVPPTEDEVRSFAADRGLEIDAEYFVAYYTGVGWTMGRSGTMKDWRSAVVAWVRRAAAWEGAGNPRCEVCLRRGVEWRYEQEELAKYEGDQRLICIRCSDRLVRLGFVDHAPACIPEVDRAGALVLVHPEPLP
jgi:hypothetical protein